MFRLLPTPGMFLTSVIARCAKRAVAIQMDCFVAPLLAMTDQISRNVCIKLLLPLLLLLVSPLAAADLPANLSAKASAAAEALETADHPLAGSWRIDLGRSTELSPWKDYELTFTTAGDTVTIHRRLAWGRREFTDEMTVGPGQPVIVPVALWPDNRHLGAYIGGDRTKHVRTEWIDAGRVLRLSTDLVLSTQQGERAVNILSDYKVSANGVQLILTELRSTRNRPVVYVFTRKTEGPKS